MRNSKLIIVLSIILTACVSSVSGVKDITAKDLKRIIETDTEVQLLDVRFSNEIKKGMISNAFHVNVISADFQSKVVNVLDIEKPVYVYCGSGARSKIASKLLLDKGYEVFNVKGGYNNWLKEN